MRKLTIANFPELDYTCSEAVNTLCTNLIYCGDDIRSIVLTSRYENEGKSTLNMEMMRTLAGFGKRVLLVDADLRKSVLAQRYMFQVEEGGELFGLVQYLAGMCSLSQAIYETDIENAYIIPAGRDVLNSMQLLTSPRLGQMMEQLRELFDLILIDAPPVGVIVDAVEIAGHCDGALLVVSYNRGRKQDLREAAQSITQSGCKLLGAVLNNVKMDSFSSRKYAYNSHYYYAKGKRRG